jgi:hypothetical protein
VGSERPRVTRQCEKTPEMPPVPTVMPSRRGRH